MRDSYINKNAPANLPFAIKRELTTDQARTLQASHQSLKDLKKDCK